MMEKCRFEQYCIFHNGHQYKIVVIPFINAVMLDAHGREELYEIHSKVDEADIIAKVMAIMIRDPQAIVYLPIKKKSYYGEVYFNVIFTRHSITKFKPSLWYELKKSIGNRTKSNNYKFSYDRTKICDYWNNVLRERIHEGRRKHICSLFRQTELGDTIFCQYSLEDYYAFHFNICNSIRYIKNNEDAVWDSWGAGWVVGDKYWDYE